MDANTKRWEKRFSVPVIVAGLITIPLLIASLHKLDQPWSTIVAVANALAWGVFAAELVVMLIVVPNRWAWLRTHPLEVAVVVLTPPFLDYVIQSLRVLGALRVLRLFRLGPAIRKMFSLQGIRYGALLSLLVVIGGAEAFSAAENASLGNSIYWAITTLTTVGYGDIVPRTAVAKVVACAVMLMGIGFFALLTGAVAERFLNAEAEQVQEGLEDVEAGEAELVDELAAISERVRRLETRLRQRTEPRRNPGYGRRDSQSERRPTESDR
jgi:voltage-gated potassium channel